MPPRSAPPAPRPAIHIGVTGHRMRGLQAADPQQLRTRIREVLERVSQQMAAEVQGRSNGRPAADPPALRVISPLAEGADQLVAVEALALGFELHCPLPFARQEYELDFPSGRSREEFRALLARAVRVLELPGSRLRPEAEQEAYEAVGRTVLAESDLLLAIWDGESSWGRGGTGQIVEEATRRGIPVVWIQARAPHPIEIRLPNGSTADLGQLSVPAGE